MALSRSATHEEFNPFIKIYNYIKYQIDFKKNHPDYFKPDGLCCFVGKQGSGKTLSAVNYVYNLKKKYPKAIIVTNLLLTDYPFDNQTVFEFKNNDDFSKYKNGEYGVIFLIDEIHLYLNSLGSKNINMEVMTQISQQRKQRIHIVCTSQLFSRLAKPIREQMTYVVKCNNFFGFLQTNEVICQDDINEDSDNMQLSGKVQFSFHFVHDPKYYKRYDTYFVISQNQNNFVSGEMQKERGNLYDSRYNVNIKSN